MTAFLGVLGFAISSWLLFFSTIPHAFCLGTVGFIVTLIGVFFSLWRTMGPVKTSIQRPTPPPLPLPPPAKSSARRFSFRIFTTCAVTVLIIAIATFFGQYLNLWMGIGVFVGLATLFLVNGVKIIPSKPTHVALVRCLNAKTDETVEEGWRFFPFYPWLYDFVLVSMEQRDDDLSFDSIRTPDPDNVPVTIEVSISWTPDPEHLAAFVDIGEDNGVIDRLEDIYGEKIRDLVCDPSTGPAKAGELQASSKELSDMLLKAVVGDKIERIAHPFPVSTGDLLRYYEKIDPMPSQEARWGKHWSRLEKKIKALPGKEQVSLEEIVKARTKEIEQLQRGLQNGAPIESLGILLRKQNISKIEIEPEYLKAKEAKAIAEAQADAEANAEKIKVSRSRERIEEMLKPFPNGQRLTPQEAVNIIQTDAKQVTREIKETRISFSPETAEVVGKMGDGIGTVLLSLFGNLFRKKE